MTKELKTAAGAVLCSMMLAAMPANAQDAAGAGAPPAAVEEPEAAEPAPQPAESSAAGGSSGTQASGDASPSNTGDAALSSAESVAPVIQDVQVLGPWTQEGRSGVWRAIMMRAPNDPESYRFFVQQIEEADGVLTVTETTEITEVADVEGVITGYRADEPSSEEPSGLSLFFEILPSDAEIAETYELHFFPDAPYLFGPATN